MSEAIIDCCAHFAQSYEGVSHPAFRELEKQALGCDFGGTSWTTREQANLLGDWLQLDESSHLLELGAGTGWPSLYLASQSGCRATLLDLPENALHEALQRTLKDGLTGQVQAVSGSGHKLPFPSGQFNVIGHSDVLCCLPEKQEMLVECRRVAKNGAHMAFAVIAIGGDIDSQNLAEAIEIGPPFIDAPGSYPEMLARAGWRLLEQRSVNTEYQATLLRFIDGLEKDETLFRSIMGDQEYEDSISHRQRQVKAVEKGLLVRDLYRVEALPA